MGGARPGRGTTVVLALLPVGSRSYPEWYTTNLMPGETGRGGTDVSATRRLPTVGYRSAETFVCGDHPGAERVHALEERHADLVVMGTSPRR